MQLNIESFDEMPESLSMPKNKQWQDVSDQRSRDSRAWEHSNRGNKGRKNKPKKNRR